MIPVVVLVYGMRVALRLLNQVTGLTGLKPIEKPHWMLRAKYTMILNILKQMPEDSSYRENTQAIIGHHLNLVETTVDPMELAGKLDSGRIEEVIIQADNELHLARDMLKWKPWEQLIAEAPKNQWKWPM